MEKEDFAVFDGNGNINNVSLITEIVIRKDLPRVSFLFDEDHRVIAFPKTMDYINYHRLHSETPFRGNYAIEVDGILVPDCEINFPRKKKKDKSKGLGGATKTLGGKKKKRKQPTVTPDQTTGKG